MPDKDIDRREEILNCEHRRYCTENGISAISTPHFPRAHSEVAKISMDEYFTERAYELLEYMANNHVKCGFTGDGSYFNFKGECITKEQLFENFL